MGDPYGPYPTSATEHDPASPYFGADADAFVASNQALPLVANASPFQRADMYDDDFDERKSFRSDDYDGRTSHHDDSMSNFGTESYAPSRNMFQNQDKTRLMDKEALPGEILEGETSEVLKESSARRRWVALCWALTWWVPTPLLRWLGRMKRMDVRQAWREKLALNMLIWLICACAVFVIAVLGNVICPTEHVFSLSELADHAVTKNPNNVFISIRGEVFDLTQIAPMHQRVVGVVPSKAILKYGGAPADDLFPVQASESHLTLPRQSSSSAYI
jgi:chitin synthase